MTKKRKLKNKNQNIRRSIKKNIKMKYSNGTTRNIESDYRYFNESILN